MTPTQIKTCWAITHVFETGRARGDYSALAVLDDGAGISYGVSQATDRSGALDEIVWRYIDRGGEYAFSLRAHLSRLADPRCPLKENHNFRQLLVDAGGDPVMREVQDEVFQDLYWDPAERQGTALGLIEPLSYACLYDLAIQSGPGRLARLRRRFPEVPPVRGGGERSWIRALNDARQRWLLTLSSAAARASIYRTRALRVLMDEERWDLALPLEVRSITIAEEDL